MRVLDAFCKEGGAGWGYSLGGATEVVGVDIAPQPRYPHTFIQADAVQFIRDHGAEFDFIHGSPPCQLYSATQRLHGKDHPDLIGPTREAILSTGRPGVIENVADALPEMLDPITLCGPMFGLNTYRHRLFEPIGWALTPPEHAPHTQRTVKMGRPLAEGDFYHAVGHFTGVDYVRRDMDAPWMSRDGLSECIPPAYAKYVAEQFLAARKGNR
ncbi:SAM-dependent methyltransferase [Streptomyces sp. NPDC055006]